MTNNRLASLDVWQCSSEQSLPKVTLNDFIRTSTKTCQHLHSLGNTRHSSSRLHQNHKCEVQIYFGQRLTEKAYKFPAGETKGEAASIGSPVQVKFSRWAARISNRTVAMARVNLIFHQSLTVVHAQWTSSWLLLKWLVATLSHIFSPAFFIPHGYRWFRKQLWFPHKKKKKKSAKQPWRQSVSPYALHQHPALACFLLSAQHAAGCMHSCLSVYCQVFKHDSPGIQAWRSVLCT